MFCIKHVNLIRKSVLNIVDRVNIVAFGGSDDVSVTSPVQHDDDKTKYYQSQKKTKS